MSKQPRLNLKAIVAASGPQRSSQADVVHLEASSLRTGTKRPETLKQRARQLSVYLEPAVYDQLRELAFTERTKIHTLMLEGLDLLFRQRGSLSIEQIKRSRPVLRARPEKG